MAEHPIQGLMATSMEKIKEMVDVNTIIGEPIHGPDGTMIIPVSKVSFGFASGGSDLPTKSEKPTFGGAGGAGITLQPLAFLVISKGTVKLLPMPTGDGAVGSLVNMVPEAIDKIGAFFNKDQAEQAAETGVSTEE